MRLLALLLLLAAAAACVTPQPVVRVEHQLSVTGAGNALSRITADPVDELRPSLSPDGTLLLFDVAVNGGQGLEQTIVGVDPNLPARRNLYTANTSQSRESAWFPDSRGFVYTTNSLGKWSLVRALSSAPNAAISVVVSGDMAPYISRPAVAPNGKRVAFSCRIRERWQLGVADIDGTHFTLLGEGFSPAWSPDGSKLAFQRFVDGYDHVFLVDASTGTNLVQLTSGASHDQHPSWAPDGKSLVFSSSRGWNTRPGATEDTRNLFVIAVDGTGLMQLTDGDAETAAPFWGRDGWIYFSSNQAGDFDIWRLKPKEVQTAGR